MRKRTERTVLRRLQSPQPSSHPNPTVIVSFLVLKCSQVTWLWVFKSRYDLLEEVKSLEELSGGKAQQRASRVLHPQCSHPECTGLCLHSRAPATQPSPWTAGVSLSWEETSTTTPPPCLQHAFLAS